MKSLRVGLWAFALITAGLGNAVAQEPQWRMATSLTGEPKYASEFKHYDYVNPDAPKTGTLNQIAVGTFDSLNPFVVQGVPAAGLVPTGGFLYDSLMVDATDQPSTTYPLIAEAIQYPDDFSWVKFRLNPKAKWHDGKPITVDDVIWSFDVLKKQSPMFNKYYHDVERAEKVGKREVLFSFSSANNRELPQIVGQMPILPKHWWNAKNADGKPRDISRPTLEIPLGSSAYKIEKIVPGKSIVWKRADNYWGEKLPVNIGRNNFERLSYEYYLSDDATWEAFKKGGLYDYRIENRAQRWVEQYNFPAALRGDVIKTSFDHHSYGVMQGFFLNTRREKFQDIRVRKALTYLYDFETANRTLFFNRYKRIRSFFEGTPLAARDLPSSNELTILETVKEEIPAEVFTQPYELPIFDSPQSTRTYLREALKLFAEAGWTTKNGQLVNAQGKHFAIEFLGADQTAEKIFSPYLANLRRVGIDASIRIVDTAQYEARVNDFDYDVITSVIAQSYSPGNEQREMWGSAAADFKGSRNYAGIKNPAIDKLIDRLVFAKDYDDLITATHALDRVLLNNYYVIPQYYSDQINIAYWNKFGFPQTQPDYAGIDVFSWWIDKKKEDALKQRGE